MKVDICRATEDDIDRLSKFFDEVIDYLEENTNYPKWEKGVYPSKESISNAVANDYQYICVAGDEVVGAFVFNQEPQGAYDKADWSVQLYDGEYMVIHSLAVHPSYYGQGIGGQMVEYCAEVAEDTGFAAIRLDVVPDNNPAISLYEHHGFTYVGEYDLERGIEGIPTFALFERNFDED